MDYSLAKRLKDAGFVKEHVFDGDGWCYSCNAGEGKRADPCHPTIEELIEACAPMSLIQFPAALMKDDQKIWFAEGGKLLLGEKEKRWEVGCKGSTPTEAVANLWLAINEKTK